MQAINPTHCLNCSTALVHTAKFCPNCGQKTSTHRLSFHDIWHDLVHAFTHADKGFPFLLLALIKNPGLVIKEYVAGKRVKYFSPSTFLLIIVGLASLAMGISHFMEDVTRSTGAGNNPVSQFLNKHVNVVILLNVPLLALFTKWLFKGVYNFAECLVMAAYTSALRSVFFTICIAPLWMIFHSKYTLLIGVYAFIWCLFYGFVCQQVFAGKTMFVFGKGFLVAVLTQLTSMVITFAAFYVYFFLFKVR